MILWHVIVATRDARERLQSQNDKHEEILSKILAKQENKFCADCLSKGILTSCFFKNKTNC